MAVTIPLGSSGTAGRSEVVGTGTSPTLSEPAAAKNGDVLFAFALSSAAGAVTRPAGWTPLYAAATANVAWDVSWIRRGETAPSLTWGLTGSVYREIYVVCLQSTAGIITLAAQSASGTTGNSALVGPDPPPATPTAPTSLALCMGFHFDGSVTSAWACAGYTAQTVNALGDDGCLFSKALSVAGIEDPPQWTTGASGTLNDFWNGATVTFTDVPPVTPSYTSSPPVIRKTLRRQQQLEE